MKYLATKAFYFASEVLMTFTLQTCHLTVRLTGESSMLGAIGVTYKLRDVWFVNLLIASIYTIK